MTKKYPIRVGWAKLSLLGLLLVLASAWAAVPILNLVGNGQPPLFTSNPGREEMFAHRHSQILATTKANQRIMAYTRFMDRMIEERFVYAPAIEAAVDWALSQHPCPPEFIGAVDRIAAALCDPGFLISNAGFNRAPLKKFLARHHNALRGLPPEGVEWAATPWGSPVRVLAAADVPNANAFGPMLVVGDFLYAFALTSSEANGPAQTGPIEYGVQLVRAPLSGGKVVVLSQVRFSTPLHITSVPVLRAQSAGESIYALIDLASQRGVFEFPTNGGSVTRLDPASNRPWAHWQSFAVLGDRLYLGERDCVVMLDLSNNRVEPQKVLDGRVFEKLFLIDDPPRNRVIVFLKPEGDAPEIWALDGGSDNLTRIHGVSREFQPDRIDRSGNTVVLSSRAGFFVLDLELNKLDELPRSSERGASDWLSGPHLVHNNHVWSANAFGRINIATMQREYFQPIGANHRSAWPGFDLTGGCLTMVQNDTKLVYGTRSGAWVLPLCEAK